MEPGQAVRYKGKPVDIGARRLGPGAEGEVIGTHKMEEIWVAVQWATMTRPTFHLQTELEVISRDDPGSR